MNLTHLQIRKMADRSTFIRGEAYYIDGKVHAFTCKGHTVRANVQGSLRRPYKVTVGLAQGIPVVRCTCPYDWAGLCKHGVAVLLHLIDHPGKQSAGNAPHMATLEAKESAPGLNDFLLSVYDAPRLQLTLTVKALRSIPARGFPFGLAIVHQGSTHKISNLDEFLAPQRHTLNDHLPPTSSLVTGQEYFLKMLRGFIHETSVGADTLQWRLRPFQLSALLDVVSTENGIDIIEPVSLRNYVLTLDPPVGLRAMISLKPKNKISVMAQLVDPLQPDRNIQIADVFAGNRAWAFDETSLNFHLLDPRINGRFLAYFLNIQQILSSNERQHFIAGVLPQLKAFAEVVMDNPAAYALHLETVTPRAYYAIDVDRQGLAVTLSFDYAGNKCDHPNRTRDMYVERTAGEEHVLIRRDRAREDEIALGLIRDYKCIYDDHAGRYLIAGPEAMFNFLSTQIHVLAKEGDVHLSDRAKALYQDGPELRPRVLVSGFGIDWFAYDIVCTVAGEDIVISKKALEDTLSLGRKFVRLKTGEFVKLDAGAFDRIAALFVDREREGKLMLAHIPFIMDELKSSGIPVEADAQTKALYDELKDFQGIETAAIPASVDGVLRDYQRQGVSWMAFLKKFRFGGILADEMGLGKTLQALTMVQRDIEGGCTAPSLIVCPTTLVWNWEAEVKKFLPQLKVLVISGNDRTAGLKKIRDAQIVITSYALLRRDIAQYHAHKFHYLILDEAQNIKNRHTINARVVKQLNSDCRLALTGTPLENSVADIWSIFDFLMPSFLGNYERFRSFYEIPITQDQDMGKLKELSRRIAPFVLRRLKEDVIKELPEKIEQTSFCELEPTQSRIYAAMAQTARKEASAAYQKKGFQRSRMLILTLILRLRQICCHPELAGIRSKHRIGVSAKMDLLKETLLELLSSGHRVLIFSQFVGMLHIIREHLNREKVVYEYMDGQTKDRQKPVERFNNDPAVKVFLLSLKVGGLGLNLTSADTVILYEPWWNPAVEQQAIDRTHRIGQKNAVLAYHFIARGTIEEKIQELQQRKRFLMSSLVLSEKSIAKKLDWDDIKFLLGFDETDPIERKALINKEQIKE